MEDLQVIIYIIFGIIYLIFSVLKKRNKGPETGTPPLFDEEEEARAGGPYQHDPSSRPPASLEELLERFDHAKQRARSKAAEKQDSMLEQVDDEFEPVAANEPMIRNMEAEALAQMERTERLKTLQEEFPAKARVEILEQQKPLRKASPAKARLSGNKRVKEPGRRFKPYDMPKQAPAADQIRKLLSSRKRLQQAFILTEVLNRKHF